MEMVLNNNFNALTIDELSDIDAGGLFSKICSTVGCVLIGAGGIAGGVALMITPEPTTATKIGGYGAITAGVGALCEIPGIWGW